MITTNGNRWSKGVAPAGVALAALAAALVSGAARAGTVGANPVDPAVHVGTRKDGADPGGATARAADGGSSAVPLAEIVVTAQKRPQMLHSVPAAVSVVTAADIAQSNAKTIEGLINQVPDLSITKSDIPYNSALFLRGVGTNSFALGAEPSVAYVLDGVVMPTSGQAFRDLVDVARMEVLPGPQGTLYGKNASAGVINVVSVMPRDEYDGEVTLGYYEGDETRMSASVDLPLTSKLLTRTTVFSGKYGGNITNLYEPSQGSRPSAANGYDHQGVRSIWRFLPMDNLEFTLIGAWRQADDNCCAFVSTPPGSVPTGGDTPAIVAGFNQLLAPIDFNGIATRQIDQSLTTKSLQRGHSLSLQADWHIGQYTITDIVAYNYWWFNEIRDGDYLPATAPYVGAKFEQEHDVGPQTTTETTNELRLTSPSGGVLQYVAGLYYYHTAQNRFFQRNEVRCTASTLPPVMPGLTPCLPGASTYTFPSASATYGSHVVNYAAYAHGSVRVMRHLRLIAGLRETHDWIGIYHNYVPSPVAGGGLIAANCKPAAKCAFEGAASTTHSNLSGEAGLKWDITSNEMAYFTYSRGYKGPAFNVYFNQTASQAAPLPPETSVAYELGLKSSFLDKNAYLNVALYHETFNNFQANNPVLLNGVLVTTLADAGSAATQGLEVAGAARLTPAWTVHGGLAYTNAHVVQFNSPPGANPYSIAPPGSPLPHAPKLKYNIATNYRVSNVLSSFDLMLHTDYDYTSSQYEHFATCTAKYCPQGGEDPNLRLGSYGIWNASVGLSDRADRLQITFLVKNILDKHYAYFSSLGGPGGSVRYFIPRDGDRYWGIQLHYNFSY